MTLSVRLLGSVRVAFDGRAVATNLGANTLTVLAYLLLHRATPLARNAIAFALFPDEPESDALVRLRRYLFRLNAALPPTDVPWIVGDKWTLQWNTNAPLRLDVDEFRRLHANAGTQAEAIALYEADLLAAFEGEWIEPIRTALREAYTDALHRHALALRTSGDPHTALTYTARLLVHDPWREDAVRLHMELRAADGDRAGALQTYRDFAGRLADELHTEPMAETSALARRLSMEPAEPRDHLPASVTSFIGREDERALLRAMLQSGEHRAITLIGTGGVGKSRLALETARSLPSEAYGEIRLVELARIRSADDVPAAIAAAFAIADDARTPLLELVSRALRSRSLLLILDNCEHVLDAAGEAAAFLLRVCPHMTILATSRVVLRISGETRFAVIPLAVPNAESAHADPLAFAAVKLLINRAAKSAPTTVVTDEAGLVHLAQIVRRVEGIPLSIELAAGRLGTMTIAEIARGLNDRFRVLIGESRDALPQHRSVRALIEWSFQLLSTQERALAEFIALFAGGMTMEAAQAFQARRNGANALDVLAALIDKSVIVAIGSSSTRYTVLESIAEYALDNLAARGELDDRKHEHANWFADQAACAMATWGTFAETEWLAVYAPDFENFRAALEFCLDEGADVELGARIAADLLYVFRHVAPHEGVRRLQMAHERLAPAAPARLRADVLFAIGSYAAVIMTHPGWIAANERAIALYETLGDRERRVRTLFNLSTAYGASDDHAAAYETAVIATASCRELDNPRLLQIALRALGLSAGVMGHDDERFAAFDECLRVYVSADGNSGVGNVERMQAYIESRRGNYAGARAHYQRAIEIYGRRPDLELVTRLRMLDVVAQLSYGLGDPQCAWDAVDQSMRLVDAGEVTGTIPQAAAFAQAASGNAVDAARLLGFVAAQEPVGNLLEATHALLLDQLRNALGEHRLPQLEAEGRMLSAAAMVALLRPALPTR